MVLAVRELHWRWDRGAPSRQESRACKQGREGAADTFKKKNIKKNLFIVNWGTAD